MMCIQLFKLYNPTFQSNSDVLPQTET